jgi:hypothetical protein
MQAAPEGAENADEGLTTTTRRFVIMATEETTTIPLPLTAVQAQALSDLCQRLSKEYLARFVWRGAGESDATVDTWMAALRRLGEALKGAGFPPKGRSAMEGQ